MKRLSFSRLMALILAVAGFSWSVGANAGSLSDLTYNEAGGYYEISSVQDMLTLSAYVGDKNNCEGLTFKVVVSELDFKDVENFAPIGLDLSIPRSSEFSGIFDGNNAVIKNLSINSYPSRPQEEPFILEDKRW